MSAADAEEISLRPKTLDDYVGQEKAKGNLKVYLRAAQQRGEPMDHILLYGPPGLVNDCHAFAPSIFAASISSVGMFIRMPVAISI